MRLEPERDPPAAGRRAHPTRARPCSRGSGARSRARRRSRSGARGTGRRRRELTGVEVAERLGRAVGVRERRRAPRARAGPARLTAASAPVTLTISRRSPRRRSTTRTIRTPRRARRGRRHVEEVVGEPRDGAVVHDPAAVGREHAVADPARREVGEAVRVQPVEQLRRRRGPSTISLPSVETSITPADSCTARTSAAGFTVIVRAAPLARPRIMPPRSRGGGGAASARRLDGTPGERPIDRRPRRARRRRPDAAAAARSHATAAGPSRGGRACPGTGPSSRSCTACRARSSRSPPRRALEVLDGDVLAEADEALVPVPHRGRGRHRVGILAAVPRRSRSSLSRVDEPFSPSPSVRATSRPTRSPDSAAIPHWP